MKRQVTSFAYRVKYHDVVKKIDKTACLGNPDFPLLRIYYCNALQAWLVFIVGF